MESMTSHTPDAEDSLTYEDWIEQYRPIANTVAKYAPFDGLMFETYGTAAAAVAAADPACVWTIVDVGTDGLWLLSGGHWVNRLGYFITERPWTAEHTAEICLG